MSFDKTIKWSTNVKRWTYVFDSPELKDEAEQKYKSIKVSRPKCLEEFNQLTDTIDEAIKLVIAEDKAYKDSKKIPVQTEKEEEEEKETDEEQNDSESSFDSNASIESDRFSMPIANCRFNIHRSEVPNYKLMERFANTEFDFSDVKFQEGYEKYRKEWNQNSIRPEVKLTEKMSVISEPVRAQPPSKNAIELAKSLQLAVKHYTSTDLVKSDLLLSDCEALWIACKGDLPQLLGITVGKLLSCDDTEKELIKPVSENIRNLFTFHHRLMEMIVIARAYLI